MRIRRYLLTALLCFAPSVWAQQDAHPSKGSDLLGQSRDEFRTKLDSGRVLPSYDYKKYLFVPAKPTGEGSKEAPSAWTYGEKLLKPEEATSVDVQIGVRDNRPVYLPVLIPKDKAKSASTDINTIIGGADHPSWFGNQVQACSRARECVKTCPDGEGGNYCCRWECKVGK